MRIRTTVLLCITTCLAVTLAIAQSRDRQPDEQKAGTRNRSTDGYHQRDWRPRRIPSRSEFPTWEIQSEFKEDVFTFVPVQYDAYGPFGWWDLWDNVYLSSAQRTAVEPMNIAERLFGKFMN